MTNNPMENHTIHEIIAMAWADEISFDAIARTYYLTEKQVIALMRTHLKPSSFKLWRTRVTGRTTKHEKKYATSTP